MKKRLILVAVISSIGLVGAHASAASVDLMPVADTFLSEFEPTHNIGGQTNFAAGTVSNGTRTRALLRFDLADAIPPSARIMSAKLRLTVTRVIAGGGVNSTFTLHRVLQAWNEGSQKGNLGAVAQSGETTWNSRLAPNTPWSAPGGDWDMDVASNLSASAMVEGLGEYSFGPSDELTQDLQFWLNHPEQNHGWMLMTDQEDISETARRFASREDSARAPTLTVEYETGGSEFRFTGISLTNNQILLQWTQGQPTYQVQKLTRIGEGTNWMNIGEPVMTNMMMVPMSEEQAFYRVVSDYSARYQLLFEATWSPTTHPQDYPAGSHWSGLVGGVHHDQVHFFREGEPASEGIRLMAELGSQPRLLSEVAAAVTNGTAHFQLSGGGINPSPGSRSLVFPQPMNRDFPLVTVCSMVAPSPDWFVGVDSLSLIENGSWVTNKVVPLYAYDAGTDSGASYASPDLVTEPRVAVTCITGFPAQVNGEITPFGTFTFTRIE